MLQFSFNLTTNHMEVIRVDYIEILRWLSDKENGGGVQLNTLAKYCNCHFASLSNILRGKYPPTDKMLISIERGLKMYFNDIKEKMGE